jgi:hypothetical protein
LPYSVDLCTNGGHHRASSQGRDEGLAEGRAEGEQQALLEVLSARGLHVTEEERAHITWCTDPAQLMSWLRKSLTITAVGELFD